MKHQIPLILSVVIFSSFIALALSNSVIRVGLGRKHITPTYRNYNHHAKRLGAPSFPVGGNVWPVAIYWCFLHVGTPSKPYPVAIDTGSFTMSVIGQNCSTCITKPPNRVYDPSASSTSSVLSCSDSNCQGSCSGSQCSFSDTYQTCDLSNPDAPCTISGVWFTDMVSVSTNVKPVPIDFGAITFQTSNFNQFQNIDAIVGLIQVSSNDPTDVFLSLYEAGSVSQNVFGMCLLLGSGSSSNGTITFGGIDESLYTGSIHWTANVGLESSYSMNLKALTVFGQRVTQVASSAILDSGTNVLLLPNEAFLAVASVFYASCGSGSNLVGICNVPKDKSLFSGNCFAMTVDQINAFPNITLNVEGVDIVMNPPTYLNRFDPESPNPLLYCLGIRNTGRGGFTIIGDTSMSNYYVVFDNENSRIGWADVNLKNCGSQPLLN